LGLFSKVGAKRVLLKPARFFNQTFAYGPRVEAGYARGAAGLASRKFDATRPTSWEFGGFSQNGEDGVIDHLLSLIESPNRYFVEIGASDGIQNNTAFLAFVKNYSGLMVEGDGFKSEYGTQFLQSLNWSVDYVALMVEPDEIDRVMDVSLVDDPDLLSLDIDGNDYFVMKALLERGMRPKVICVEYNSAFGPTSPKSIAYTPGLDYQAFHPSQLYYGVSIGGWQALFGRHGYRFVTVESRGVNGFFVDPDAVALFPGIEGPTFAENATQLRRHRTGWQGQFAQISKLPLITVPEAESD
jgi:hypothetical protein